MNLSSIIGPRVCDRRPICHDISTNFPGLLNTSLSVRCQAGPTTVPRGNQTTGSLPFYEDISCALGIIVKTYLDELHNKDDPTSESERADMKVKGKGWLRNGDFQASFDNGMKLWDAVSKASEE